MERQVGPAGSNNPSQTVNYSYDAVNQLTGEVASETSPLSSLPYVNQSQSFDRMGNKLTAETKQLANGAVQSTGTTAYTANKLNQLTGALWTPPTGLSTETSYLYDTSGNLQSTGNNRNSANTTYTYDELDRLTQVVVKDTTGVNSHKSEFVYDSFNRKRISREYSWNNGAWQKDDETRRVYDGMDVVQERDANNATLVTYTRSGNIGGLLARTVKANTPQNSTSNDVDYFYHYDGSGNVVGLTNNQQVAVAEYSYDAWGNTVKMSGVQALNNKYRFSTKEAHSSIGLYDFGYRFYNSGTGRWLNRDPLSEGGGLNLYAAFGNTPPNAWDAYGLVTASIVNGTVSGGFGLGGSVGYGLEGGASFDEGISFGSHLTVGSGLMSPGAGAAWTPSITNASSTDGLTGTGGSVGISGGEGVTGGASYIFNVPGTIKGVQGALGVGIKGLPPVVPLQVAFLRTETYGYGIKNLFSSKGATAYWNLPIVGAGTTPLSPAKIFNDLRQRLPSLPNIFSFSFGYPC